MSIRHPHTMRYALEALITYIDGDALLRLFCGTSAALLWLIECRTTQHSFWRLHIRRCPLDVCTPHCLPHQPNGFSLQNTLSSYNRTFGRGTLANRRKFVIITSSIVDCDGLESIDSNISRLNAAMYDLRLLIGGHPERDDPDGACSTP